MKPSDEGPGGEEARAGGAIDEEGTGWDHLSSRGKYEKCLAVVMDPALDGAAVEALFRPMVRYAAALMFTFGPPARRVEKVEHGRVVAAYGSVHAAAAAEFPEDARCVGAAKVWDLVQLGRPGLQGGTGARGQDGEGVLWRFENWYS